MPKESKKNSAIERFIELSEALTAHDRLSDYRDGDRSLAESYYELIETAFGDERLTQLLSVFDSAAIAGESPIDKIMADTELAEITQEIIMLWYMSSFKLPDAERDGAPKTPEQYFQGLFWPTIHAHPLGLSGGYFGYWRYPPEN